MSPSYLKVTPHRHHGQTSQHRQTIALSIQTFILRVPIHQPRENKVHKGITNWLSHPRHKSLKRCLSPTSATSPSNATVSE